MAVMDGVCVCVCGHGEAVLDDHDTQSNTVDINIMLPSSPSLPPPIFHSKTKKTAKTAAKPSNEETKKKTFKWRDDVQCATQADTSKASISILS